MHSIVMLVGFLYKEFGQGTVGMACPGSQPGRLESVNSTADGWDYLEVSSRIWQVKLTID